MACALRHIKQQQFRGEKGPCGLVRDVAPNRQLFWTSGLPNSLALRYEQQHDAADRAGDADDQLGTHILLPQEGTAQQQGHQRIAGDQR